MMKFTSMVLMATVLFADAEAKRGRRGRRWTKAVCKVADNADEDAVQGAFFLKQKKMKDGTV